MERKVESFIDKYDEMIQGNILKSKLFEEYIPYPEEKLELKKNFLVIKVLYARTLITAMRKLGHDPDTPKSYKYYLDALEIINLDYSYDDIIDVIKRVQIFDPKNSTEIELKRAFFEGFMKPEKRYLLINLKPQQIDTLYLVLQASQRGSYPTTLSEEPINPEISSIIDKQIEDISEVLGVNPKDEKGINNDDRERE